MKNLKRLTALLAACIMLFTMTATAFAEGEETPAGSTVTNETDHYYYAYQIFSGTQAKDDTALGDLAWGNGINTDKIGELLEKLKLDSRFNVGVDNANIFASCTTEAKAVADVLSKYEDNSDVAKAFANVVSLKTGKKDDPTTFLNENSYTIEPNQSSVNMAPGYYLLYDIGKKNDKDEFVNPGQGDAYNTALLQVTKNGDIHITKKYNVPTVEKNIIETDGTATKITDASIGDVINFEMIGTLPENYDDFEFYRYVFRDTMNYRLELIGTYPDPTEPVEKPNDPGKFEYPKRFVTDGITVEVLNDGMDPVDITEQLTTDDPAGMNNDKKWPTEISIHYQYNKDTKQPEAYGITVFISNLKELTGVTINKDTKIKVTYSAKLTEDARTGIEGQDNSVYLEYSRDPNNTTDPNDVNPTPTDRVWVLTYELDVDKVDSQDSTKKLDGAEFILYRENESGKKEYVILGERELKNGEKRTQLTDWTENKTEATTIKPTAGKPFPIIGLDSGAYYLEETKAPAGYNKLEEPEIIKIGRQFGDKKINKDAPNLTSLTITTIVGEKISEGTGNIKEGTVEAIIANAKGSLLPSTGGIGTTIFYVAGGLLAVGALIVLVTRARMNKA